MVDEVTKLTRMRKYEELLSPNLVSVASVGCPGRMPKTNEPRLRSFPETADGFAGRECLIRQKLGGTPGTYYLRGGEFVVCRRNLEVLYDPAPVFWRRAREHCQRRWRDSAPTSPCGARPTVRSFKVIISAGRRELRGVQLD